MGRSWVSQYTLAPHMFEAEKVEEPRDLLNPFDIRNAQGIFTIIRNVKFVIVHGTSPQISQKETAAGGEFAFQYAHDFVLSRVSKHCIK